MEFDLQSILGKPIIYTDYLGFERAGKIGFVEPYNGPENDDSESGIVVWLYVVDEDPQYNTHAFIYNAGTDQKPDVKRLFYADMRLSTEVHLDLKD